MENKDTIQFNLYIKIVFYIYCFQEEIYEKNESDFETPHDTKSSKNSIFYVKKDVIKKFKDLLDYEFFCNNIIKNSNILNELKDNGYLSYKNGYKDYILNDLHKQLEKYPDYVNKVKNLKENEIIEEMKKIDENDWEYENVTLQKGDKTEEIKLIKEFEIINEYIFDLFNTLFKNRNIDVLKGSYIFGGNKMIILIINKEDIKCLIGNLKRNGTFNSEYLIDINNFHLAEFLMNDLINIGLKTILKEIDKKKEVYNILIKEKIIIYRINNNNNINNINIINDYIKNNNNFEIIWSENIKTLILLSLIQKKIHEINEQKLVKVFLINEIALKILKFDVINDLIKSNNEILDIINNIRLNDLTMNFIDEKIINKLDEKELKHCEEIISRNEEFRDVIKFIPYKAVSEEIKLFNSKKITVFTNFLFIPENLLEYFKKNFQIEEIELNFSHKFINNKDILIDDKQSIIYIIKAGNKDFSYNIEYILDFKHFNLNIINDFQNLEYENYINEKEEDNSLFPIFMKDKIIGSCYKYKSVEKDYSNFIDYSKYFESKVLINIISLYANYKKINMKLKSKNNNKLEKYYLVNHEFINDNKNKYGYKQIYDYLQEKIENINISENDNYNIFTLLKCIPVDLLEQYKDKKIEDDLRKSMININIEPSITTINKYVNNIQDEPLLIYDNFEIIEKKILNNYVDIYENENLFSECIFNDGKIFVNLPNYLIQNKFISLVGCLDEYYNYFIVDYILIYNNENDRKIHIPNISQNFNLFLNEIKFSDNYKQININNISFIIIKYEKDNNENSNIINHGNSIIIDNENNNIINADNEMINKNKLIENFKSCPNIGLQNIGATCYMNATLQCFCHISKFVEYFKYNANLADIVGKNNNLLSTSFKILIDELWPDNFDPSSPNHIKYYSPEDFKAKISKMNPLFEGIAANDSKDLVNFIIMTLHLELNKVNIINEENNDNEILDQTNKQLIYINFFKEVYKKNNSIISELFYAINCNATRCPKCNYQIYNCQIYFFIIFPLEEVRKFKNYVINQQNMINMINNMNNQVNNMNMFNQYNIYMMNGQYQFNNNNNINNINEVNIYDCFEYDRKINYMTGDNCMYCNICKSQQDCYMSTNLVTGPEILILLLNRGNGIEFNVKIEFYEDLNLYNYIEYKNTGFNYRLIGVISHLGESGMGGHFIAYCRDPIILNKWYKYNDAIVDEVKDFKKEIIDFAMPYLLFYQKIKV